MTNPAPTRWPAAMKLATAATYLDCSAAEVERLIRAGAFGCIQFGPRGDRRIRREAIDEYLLGLEAVPVKSQRAA